MSNLLHWNFLLRYFFFFAFCTLFHLCKEVLIGLSGCTVLPHCSFWPWPSVKKNNNQEAKNHSLYISTHLRLRRTRDDRREEKSGFLLSAGWEVKEETGCVILSFCLWCSSDITPQISPLHTKENNEPKTPPIHWDLISFHKQTAEDL